MPGDVYRNLRNPSVAIDRKNGRVVISFNGDEDTFIVLQMDVDAADALAVQIEAAIEGAR